MENNFLRQALNNSLVFAAISIFISVIVWITNLLSIMGLFGGIVIMIFNVIIMYTLLLIFTKNYRNTYLEGYMEYNRAFLYGLIIVVASSMLLTIYNFVFLSFIDPHYTEKIMMLMQEKTTVFMHNRGISDDKIDEALARFKEIPTPLQSAKSGFIQSVILGAILALISAAFAKKTQNTDPFKDVL